LVFRFDSLPQFPLARVQIDLVNIDSGGAEGSREYMLAIRSPRNRELPRLYASNWLGAFFFGRLDYPGPVVKHQKRMPVRRDSRQGVESRARPDDAISWMRVEAVPQYTVTARAQYCSPDSADENQTSFPDGAHANPSSDSHPVESARACPERSTSMTSPRSSTFGGCRKNATSFPSGDTLASLIQLSPSIRTFPTGYCKRHLR
jgi:hypothetical protein